MKNRILPLDGLRTIAAFGVVWIHAWTFFYTPELILFSIDLYKPIAIFGSGVDFFFVISGFCMYLMIDKNDFSLNKYRHFLKKRFLRIAPAYYASVLVYALLVKINHPGDDVAYNVLLHFLFLNNFFEYQISGPLWSIGTEWHFYMFLPLIIWLKNKFSLAGIILFISALCFILLCFVNINSLDYSWWEKQIVIRFPEFGFGIIAAHYFIRRKKLSGLLSGATGLWLAILITCFGRLLRLTYLVDMAGNMDWLMKSAADIVMTFGFAYLMFLVITEESIVARFLSSRIMTYLGRISYSIYLWHSLVFYFLANSLRKLPFNNFNPIAAFAIISGCTIVIARLSFYLFESIYFRSKK